MKKNCPLQFLRCLTTGLMLLAALPGIVRAEAPDVGRIEFQVPAIAGKPGFLTRLWYPAAGGKVQRIGKNLVRQGYLAVPDAKPLTAAPAPLIVMNHGSGGSGEGMAWLGVELVRHGAIVIAADHPGSSGGDPERPELLQIWHQPQEVGQMLDAILASPWGARIDPQRIAVVGFSLGGTAALSLAGGRLDFQRFPRFCESHDDGACRAFRSRFASLDAGFFKQANADLREARIRAAVAIAAGLTESLTESSLQGLKTPVLLISGERDGQLPPATHVKPILGWLPTHSRYVEIQQAWHFSFLPLCAPTGVAVLAETIESFACEEAGKKPREEIHQEVTAATLQFLREQRILAPL